ncbi:MAG: TldD/PmbA family protein [Candidatus Bathyarchaeota archaeon]|nr:TldD/PmbA family protein [Candidatus Bathyarchaeota archaeon]MDH5780388.1 TldD/PmbA family protein [Candidatus Bathyarchaeota archaeon]
MTSELETLANELSSLVDTGVRKALTRGAEEAEVFISHVATLAVNIKTGIIEAREGASLGIGVRVVADGKVGFAATSGMDETKIDHTIEEALGVAGIRPVDPRFKHLADPISRTSKDGIIDDAILEFSNADALEEVDNLSKAAFKFDKRVRAIFGGISAEKGVFAVANSRGIFGCSKGAVIGGGVYCIATDQGKQKTGIESLDSRQLPDFSDVGSKATDRAIKMLEAKPLGESLKTTTIWENVAIGPMLRAMLSSASSATNVQEGKSYFKGKMKEKIASGEVTIFDDGQLPEGLLTFKTDAEGVPCQKTTLVEKGVLRNYIYDSYAALQENKESTGNANRQWPEPFLTTPNVSTSNIVLKPGTSNLDRLIAEVDKGILVTGMVMGAGHANRITGEFSVVAPNAFLVKNGEIEYALEPLTIAGNFFNALKKIARVGSDSQIMAVGKISSLIIDDLTISG